MKSLLFSVGVAVLFAAQGPAQKYLISTVAGGGQLDNQPALTVSLGQIRDVSRDMAGNLYIVSEDLNQAFKISPAGIVTVFAGDGQPRFSGDGNPARLASLNGPVAISADLRGNVFIADNGNSRVRVVTPDGMINTFAGCTLGDAGCQDADGYPATSSLLHGALGLAVDNSGNLFISETDRIRLVDTSRRTSAVLSSPDPLNPTPPTPTDLAIPFKLALDINGSLYIANTQKCDVLKVVNPLARLPTPVLVAGNGTCGASAGDNGPATSARLANNRGVFVDSGKNIFIVDTMNNNIRRVDASSGNITTFAGIGPNPGFSGDGGPATSAQLDAPYALTMDPSGSSYIADSGNVRVRKIETGTNIITTVVGAGTQGKPNDGVVATSAVLSKPYHITLDHLGNYYFGDIGSYVVRRVSAAGIITTVAGIENASGYSGDHRLATTANLSKFAESVAVDPEGNLYIADEYRVRRVDAATGIINTVAGTGTACPSSPGPGDQGPATFARLCFVLDVALDSKGNLFIAEANRIRKLDTTGLLTTIAGGGTPVNGVPGCTANGDGGPAVNAYFIAIGLQLDSMGNVYFSDTGCNRIRRIDTTGVINTVAGTTLSDPNDHNSSGYTGDGGPAVQAKLNIPDGISIDAANNIYFADRGNNVVRRIDNVSGYITTIAGNGTPGYSGDGGLATIAALTGPNGIAASSTGSIILVADSQDHVVRRLDLTCSYTLTPAPSQVFTAGGGTGTETLATGSQCPWQAVSNVPWITIVSAQTGRGNTVISFQIQANPNSGPRTGTLMIAGQTITITEITAVAFVTTLYQDLLSRAPDSGGLANYVNQLNNGSLTEAQAAAQFFTSPEFSSSGLYIIKLYFAVLRRNPDFGGWRFWVDSLTRGESPTSVLNKFLASLEFQQLYGNLTNADFVTLVYQNVLGRQPDSAGNAFWLGQLNLNLVSRASLMDQFIRSPEYDQTVRARAYANLLYMGFLRRTADTAGLAFWTNTLNDPAALSEAIRGFIDSLEYRSRF